MQFPPVSVNIQRAYKAADAEGFWMKQIMKEWPEFMDKNGKTMNISSVLQDTSMDAKLKYFFQ